MSHTAVAAHAPRERWTLEQAHITYRAPIERYLSRMCGSPDLAEELAQETFLRAVVGWLAFRHECSVASWLFRIARNTYLSYLRRPRATRIDTDEFLAIPDTSAHSDPVQRLDAGERRGVIQLALAQLPEKQRTILLLRDDEGLAYAEIAEVLGISLAAVKVNLFRARHAFRAAYQAFDCDGVEATTL
ncbi:MAG: sigma-70 family RNA polymerase sigma factor [Roseiflexaceae bacterium]|nr:sigma-70 family RNA polymerase sigma factor [Roseiflexaceae bacterium]